MLAQGMQPTQPLHFSGGVYSSVQGPVLPVRSRAQPSSNGARALMSSGPPAPPSAASMPPKGSAPAQIAAVPGLPLGISPSRGRPQQVPVGSQSPTVSPVSSLGTTSGVGAQQPFSHNKFASQRTAPAAASLLQVASQPIRSLPLNARPLPATQLRPAAMPQMPVSSLQTSGDLCEAPEITPMSPTSNLSSGLASLIREPHLSAKWPAQLPIQQPSQVGQTGVSQPLPRQLPKGVVIKSAAEGAEAAKPVECVSVSQSTMPFHPAASLASGLRPQPLQALPKARLQQKPAAPKAPEASQQNLSAQPAQALDPRAEANQEAQWPSAALETQGVAFQAQAALQAQPTPHKSESPGAPQLPPAAPASDVACVAAEEQLDNAQGQRPLPDACYSLVSAPGKTPTFDTRSFEIPVVEEAAGGGGGAAASACPSPPPPLPVAAEPPSVAAAAVAAKPASTALQENAKPPPVDFLQVAQAQQEAIAQQAAQAEKDGKPAQSQLSISLTKPPPELPVQLRTDYEVEGDLLGEGAFAIVRRLRHRESGRTVALKVVEKYPLHIREMLPQLQREVRVQGNLQHQHILQLLSCVEDDEYVYMLLEYCARGSLRSLCLSMPGHRLPETQASWYFTQILQAVDFMHRRRCVHRDLKPENMLLTADNEVRICDFGWSAEVQAEQALRTTCGTPHYWAPEIFEGLPQDCSVDLWSLGTLVYELLVGHPPFWGSMEELRKKVLAVDVRYPPGLLSAEAINLFYCFLQREQRHRIPAYRILSEHPWVQNAILAQSAPGQAQQSTPQYDSMPTTTVDGAAEASSPVRAILASASAPATVPAPIGGGAGGGPGGSAVLAMALPAAPTVWATGSAAAPVALSAAVAPPTTGVSGSPSRAASAPAVPTLPVVAPAVRPAAPGRGTAPALSAALPQPSGSLISTPSGSPTDVSVEAAFHDMVPVPTASSSSVATESDADAATSEMDPIGPAAEADQRTADGRVAESPGAAEGRGLGTPPKDEEEEGWRGSADADEENEG